MLKLLNLDELIKSSGVETQKKLGETIGINPQTISRWRNGGPIDATSLAKLAAIARISARVQDLDGNVFSVSPTNSEPHLSEGERAVKVLGKAAEIIACSNRVARLMKDYGENGQVNSDEFRPIFEELREVVNGAFV